MTKRRDDWPIVLEAQIRESKEKEFDWATHNCVLFAANIVLSITGMDFMHKYRERCVSEKSALRIVVEVCGGYDVEKFIEILMQDSCFPEKPKNKAQRGDIVLINTEIGPAAAIVGSGGKVVAVGKTGVVLFPLNKATRAWGTN